MEDKKTLDIIVLYSSGHLGSALVMNKLLSMPEFNIVGVIKARPLKISFKERSKLRKHLKNIGWQFAWLLLWQRAIQGIGFFITALLPFLRKRLQAAWKIAEDNNIPVFYCNNINDQECLNFIKEQNPDLLVSAYFSQILKKDIIQAPKIGVLNIHPGLLPSYKGAMAYFWVLKNETNKAGVTVHWIDEGIDTGDILARRSFTIHQKSTQDTVLLFTAIIGAKLLQRIAKKLIANEKLEIIKINAQEDNTYYSMPKEKDFDEYFKKRRFFRIRNILGIIFKRKGN